MPKWSLRDDQQYYIYALVDPRNDSVRYIGISNDTQLRYYQHLHGGSKKYVWRWIQELEHLGIFPLLQVLETVNRDISTSFENFMRVVGDREAFWIRHYTTSGASLLNIIGVTRRYPAITKQASNLSQEQQHIEKNVANANIVNKIHSPINTVIKPANTHYLMRLEDFRIDIAVLTRQELATLADVSISSIQRAEEGKSIGRLTQARILRGLSKHLGRTVTREEIDEFK